MKKPTSKAFRIVVHQNGDLEKGNMKEDIVEATDIQQTSYRGTTRKLLCLFVVSAILDHFLFCKYHHHRQEIEDQNLPQSNDDSIQDQPQSDNDNLHPFENQVFSSGSKKAIMQSINLPTDMLQYAGDADDLAEEWTESEINTSEDYTSEYSKESRSSSTSSSSSSDSLSGSSDSSEQGYGRDGNESEKSSSEDSAESGVSRSKESHSSEGDNSDDSTDSSDDSSFHEMLGWLFSFSGDSGSFDDTKY